VIFAGKQSQAKVPPKSTMNSPSHQQRHLPYNLNTEKLSQKLADSASKANFTIEVNNNNKNVNLKCNPGTYLSSIAPVLDMIQVKQIFQFGDIKLECVEKTTGVDAAGRAVNSKLVLVDPADSDKLVIHCHHTSNPPKVQIQGNSAVPFSNFVLEPMITSHIEVNKDLIYFTTTEILDGAANVENRSSIP
jgi:hypothetical protein